MTIVSLLKLKNLVFFKTRFFFCQKFSNFGLKMKIKPVIWILIAIALIGTTYVVFKSLNGSADKKIENLNEQIVKLKNVVVPIRYKIKSQKDDKIKVVVKFLDLDSNLIEKKTFELKGNTVSFDFMLIKFQNGYIAFPYKIFTDKIAPENGIILFDYYEKNNFPQVYYSVSSNKSFNDGIKALYKKIKENDIENLEVFGSMVQNHPAASGKAIGDTYKIVVHTKGGLEIQND